MPYSKNSVRQEILPQQPQERPCRRWHFGPGFSFPAVTKKQKSLDTARFQLNWRCGCRLQAIHAVHASMPGPALSDSPKMKILSFRVLKLTANCSPIAGAHAAHAAMSAVGAITVRPCTTTPGPQSDYHQIQIPLLLLRSHPSQLQTAGARYCIPWRTLTGLHLPCGPAQRLKPCSWRRCMGHATDYTGSQTCTNLSVHSWVVCTAGATRCTRWRTSIGRLSPCGPAPRQTPPNWRHCRQRAAASCSGCRWTATRLGNASRRRVPSASPGSPRCGCRLHRDVPRMCLVLSHDMSCTGFGPGG